MSSETYRPSSIRAIIFGIIAFIILLTMICGLAEVVKFIGAPFLILPEKLGWIPDVSRKDVIPVDMQLNTIDLNLNRAGDYVVYAHDYDLLLVTDQLARANANPWLKVTSSTSGQSINLNYEQRPLIPFDSSLVRGRPIFHFAIETPGIYNFKFPKRFTVINVLPDQLTGNLGIILFSFFLQITIIGFPLAALIRGRRAKHKTKLDEIRNLKKPTNDQFWEELRRQREAQRNKPEL
ncbi:MAG: hypothetical protein BGO78_07835 [Chloroflexi bacterium 44-23]|nr:MAG: hypothetical protein BGO78_07835 [Chloroflexi bacterium 44-23]